MFVSLVTVLLCLTATVTANGRYARTTPPRNSIVVDITGTHPNSHLNLTSAIASLTNTTKPQKIFILPGTYHEQVYIPSHPGPIEIQGYTKNTLTHLLNTATLTSNLSRTVPGLTNNDQTATLRLWTSNIKIYNLNIANTFGRADTGGQALAVSAQKTDQAFYACRLTGYQDTLYANEGRQIYARSYISGAVDFIFGLRARAWFEGVDVQSVGAGWVTANGREAANNTSVYVFNRANVTGTGNSTTYLGRPWRQWSRVVFQRSYLGEVVAPQGWSRWDNVQPVENVAYGEYRNFGPGSVGESRGLRANFSRELREPMRIDEVLGKGFEKEQWVDMDFLES